MILADKIIKERKIKGWSQEDLAEKLGVSRQSVSKWEGAQSIPDLNRIIEMSKLFSCSTDYLLVDDLEEKDSLEYDLEENLKTRSFSLEEANSYLEIEKLMSKRKAFAVMLFILSPIVLIGLSGLAEISKFKMEERQAVGLGLTILMIFVLLGIYILMKASFKLKKFEFLEKELIDTEYGVDGMVKERKIAYEETHNRKIILGISLIIGGVLPLFTSIIISGDEDIYYVFSVCILLFLVGLGVRELVETSIVWSSFNKIIQVDEFSPEEKLYNKKLDPYYGAYWLLVVAIYLVYSFIWKNWNVSWVIFAVSGLLFPVYVNLLKSFVKK